MQHQYDYACKNIVNLKNKNYILNIIYVKYKSPVAEFSVSICSTPKFICSSDDSVRRLLMTKNDASYKSNISKNRMIRTSYQLKIEFITNKYLLKSERQISFYIKLSNNVSF